MSNIRSFLCSNLYTENLHSFWYCNSSLSSWGDRQHSCNNYNTLSSVLIIVTQSFGNQESRTGVPVMAQQWLMNLTSIHEDTSVIPGLAW